ncbi:MAG: DegV family protein [Bacillota bacterium]|nr:DegV family protein [Bacillota bacterium]
MAQIHIVSDSTADLSKEQVDKFGINVVPLTVSFGDELFTDGIDLTPSEFYKKLSTSSQLPKTSQPSPEVFRQIYDKIASEEDTILSIHVSGKLSGTLSSAEAASKMVSARVIPVDSLNASQGVARSVLVAAEAVRRNMALDEILSITKKSVASTISIFAVDTLEFLQRNGRIGKAASLLGSMLQLKPILYADPEGMVAVYDKVRGRSKIILSLVSAALKNVSADEPVNLSVVHSNAEDKAIMLLDELKKHYEISDLHIGHVGPAIGTHIGPGAISLMIQPSFDVLLSRA